MHQPHQPGSPSESVPTIPSKTILEQVTVQDQAVLITPPPELRRRQDDCQQISQSASQAIQQASQSASQSIQQAAQSASQSIAQASRNASQAAQQASQSASEAIQQAQNSASQSIAAASRSAAYAMSSASSMVSSMQASAASAVGQAYGSMTKAQADASSAQVAASSAVLQAGAAVAAATGSAAAAGSSFLAAAAKATQGAQASVSVIGAAASSSISQASAQVTASQTAAVTATQAALAIVGSIIASALITILIYFCIAKHKKKVRRRSREQRSPGFSTDTKFPISDQVGTTVAGSQSAYQGARNEPGSGSPVSLSQFPNTPGNITSTSRGSFVKSTSVPWNPNKPPKAPTLGSWLKVQDGVSPFGPIQLPTDLKTNSPLGGQLKSPLRSPIPLQPRSPPVFKSSIPARTSNSSLVSQSKPPTAKAISIKNLASSPPMRKPVLNEPKPEPVSQPQPPPPPTQIPQYQYRESKASVWTDDVPDPSPSPPLQTPPKQPNVTSITITPGYNMLIPSPRNPVRTTAEWLESIKNAADPPPSFRISQRDSTSEPKQILKSNFGLPRTPKMGNTLGLPKGPGQHRQVQSLEGELGFVQGLNRFLPGNRSSSISSNRNDG
ncbi:hypothetical protein G7Y89_g6056 [Cudoniella acicularis]|uniref:Uncharacterized protein n=1 Tax=Cudoniella acicularis TaxID=354080 RepID=A0A8H4RL83_9HELO|nr:hypothetical protein G7Y89_g6056 [Cudoniella acicularis]